LYLNNRKGSEAESNLLQQDMTMTHWQQGEPHASTRSW